MIKAFFCHGTNILFSINLSSDQHEYSFELNKKDIVFFFQVTSYTDYDEIIYNV